MERVRYNGTIKPNLATNSAARSFIVSVDPNNNNAVSWDRGYHFNDARTTAPVHSNGLTSKKIVDSYANIYGINNTSGWNATQYNTWNLTNFANAGIDPYSYMGTTYDPIRTTGLTIFPGSSGNVDFGGPGYAGPNSDARSFFLQPAGQPGAPWAKRAFTSTPYYVSTLLNPSPSTLDFIDVSPRIPAFQSLAMSSLSFPNSITGIPTATRTVSSYGVADGYAASNVSLSPFRMRLAVINTTGNWSYCYIPLHVSTGNEFTFKKSNTGRFELDGLFEFSAYLDRECLRLCQNYLKAGISSGLFNGTTKSYFPMLDWEPWWRFSTLFSGGTGEASLSSSGHTSKFRVTWSVYNSNKYQVSNIEQIQ